MSDEPVKPAKQDAEPEPEPEQQVGEQTNDNGGPTWQQERFEQTYPNAGMTAEDRPAVPDDGIEVSPE